MVKGDYKTLHFATKIFNKLPGGGYEYSFTRGEGFPWALCYGDSTAQEQGLQRSVDETWLLFTEKAIPLDFGDYFLDGDTLYRIISTPQPSDPRASRSFQKFRATREGDKPSVQPS